MTEARRLAHALGGDVVGRDSVAAPGPGHSPRDRSLSIKVDPNAPDGFLAYSHSGDDWRDCRDHVRGRLGMSAWQPGDEQDRRVPQRKLKQFDANAIEREVNEGPRQWTEDELDSIRAARRIWNEADDPRLTLAEQYLNEYRKLELPNDLAGTVLRFHDRCPWRDENTGRLILVPALIVAFRSIDDDSITAVHRIRLNPDGSKNARKMRGIVRRSAVKLSPAGSTLVIAEGVETAMAAQQLGFKPVWAVGSVSAITWWPVLDGIKQLQISAEAGRASADAIKLCSARWRRAGRKVQVIRSTVGSDLNDALIASKSAS